jgi:hypothetical protein
VQKPTWVEKIQFNHGVFIKAPRDSFFTKPKNLHPHS